MRWLIPTLERTDYTFGDLETQSNRVANALLELGVIPGTRIFVFLPKCPEIFFFLLGALKVQAITCILFSNFGEEALMDRMGDAGAQLVLTKKSMFNRIKGIWPKLADLRTVILTDLDQH